MQRFDPKTESKLLIALSKIFRQAEEDQISEDEAVKLDYLSVVDIDNVCMVIPKTEEARRTLSRFARKSYQPRQPSLSFVPTEDEVKSHTSMTSSYNIEYIEKIVKVLSITSDIITISLNHDTPSKLENNHFIFYLAPRIMEDF